MHRPHHFPAGIKPNAGKVAALTSMPMTKCLKQVRYLLGCLSYYVKKNQDMVKRIRPNTSFVKENVEYGSTSVMEMIV